MNNQYHSTDSLKAILAYALDEVGTETALTAEHLATIDAVYEVLKTWIISDSTVDDELIQRIINIAIHLQTVSQVAYAILFLELIKPLCSILISVEHCAEIARILSTCYTDLGDYEKAMKYGLERLMLGEKLDDYRHTAGALSLLGIIHSRLEQHHRAFEYFDRAKQIVDQTDDDYFKAQILCNFLTEYHEIGKYEKAIEVGLAAMALHQERDVNDSAVANVASNLALAYAEMTDFENAYRYANLALKTARQNKDQYWILESLIALSKVSMKQQATSAALASLQEALALSQKSDVILASQKVHELLADVFTRTGDYEKALRHFQNYHELYAAQRQDQLLKTTSNLDVLHRTEQARQEAVQLHLLRENERAFFDQMSELQQQFLSTATHDLKNPITSQAIDLAVLRKLDTVAGSPEAQRAIERMERTLHYMQMLVTDILDIAKLEARRTLNTQRVSLRTLAQDAMGRMQTVAAQKKIALEHYLSDVEVRCDPSRIQQVLENLLSNAIKYTDEGGRVHITVNCDDTAAIVSVTDTGLGIPESDLPHIFDRFYRVTNEEHVQKEGTGLGLSIVKTIIEQHGGRISVDSKLGVGTMFRFTLPVRHESVSLSD